LALLYQPRAGDIFMCEFPACFDVPEMVKTRPVIVVSPRLAGRRELVGIVPISHSEPDPMCAHHCIIPVRMLPKFMQATGGHRWVKCDMVYTFSTRRLSPVEHPRRMAGKRVYEYPRLDGATLQHVRRAIASGLGIEGIAGLP
jgi:uncharacterized protein YifN (PemK superfamily)